MIHANIRIYLLGSFLFNVLLAAIFFSYSNFPLDFMNSDAAQEILFLDTYLLPRKILASPLPGYCKDLDMLVVVHSRLHSHSRRDLWRRTYGASLLKRKFRYKLLFPLGTETRQDGQLEKSLKNELEWNNDILWMDFVDSYHNITIKQLSHLRYFVENCDNSTVLLKLDDDVGWNIEEVHNHALELQERQKPSLRCLEWRNMKVLRNNGSTWYVSEKDFNATVYPPYCSGMSYFAQWKAASNMLEALPRIKSFWIDDVFITGFLTAAGGVVRDDIAKNYKLKEKNYTLLGDTVFNLVNREDSEKMFLYWNGDLLKEEERDY